MPTSRSFQCRRRRLLIGAAAPFAAVAAGVLPHAMARAASAAQAASPSFDTALRERLARDGVGFAAVQVSPAGMQLHTLGVMRQGAPAPITAQTVFELGSMTKPFVALMFADGVLKKRWAFDDAVEDGLADGLKLRDAKGEPLRLIDLATHRSGLPRMPGNLSRREQENPYPFFTEARLFAFLRGWKPEVARGSRFEYSNLGYGLLAQVLARREGRSLDAALEERVFQPLGLKDLQIRRPMPGGDDLAKIAAALGASMAMAQRQATGHNAERRPVPDWQFDALAGAVGLAGPVEPVGRFMQAALGLYEHPMQEAFAMCLQKRTEGETPLHPFGFAWELSPIVTRSSQRMLFNQDGATGGFSNSMWIEPARRSGGAVLANAFIETRSLGLLALDPTLTQDDFALMVLPPEALVPLVGSYAFDPRVRIDIRVRQGRLWGLSPGLPEVELLPRAARRFFTRESGFELDFDEGDRPAGLTLTREDMPPQRFLRQ